MDDTVIIVNRAGMGEAPADLQATLAGTYFKLLAENGLKPLAICFYGEGVRLLVEGSPVLDALKILESRGVPLVACMTCLKYFNLVDRLRAGVIGGMGDILAAQQRAAKVITL
ncbi:MAG: DsrE family protein [Burkholderiales bacterium]|nr:DsrE family protein [Burkholderiales bacterium]